MLNHELMLILKFTSKNNVSFSLRTFSVTLVSFNAVRALHATNKWRNAFRVGCIFCRLPKFCVENAAIPTNFTKPVIILVTADNKKNFNDFASSEKLN